MKGGPFNRRMKLAKTIATWILTLMLAAMFLNAGIRKFFENGGWTWAFDNWGFPIWFRIFVGAMETAGALLLLVPRTAAYGAATIVITMIGAIGTIAVTTARIQHAFPALISLAVACIVLALRWKSSYSFQRRIDSMT
jgi:putative oxidoreductase